MKVLLIVAHPNKTSFNHAIAMTCSRVLAAQGNEVILHDLYEEHFSPMVSSSELARDAVLPSRDQAALCEVRRPPESSSSTQIGGAAPAS